MKLDEFIKNFIKPNSIIKLWNKKNEFPDKIMEWQILKDPNLCSLEVVNIFGLIDSNCENMDSVNIEIK